MGPDTYLDSHARQRSFKIRVRKPLLPHIHIQYGEIHFFTCSILSGTRYSSWRSEMIRCSHAIDRVNFKTKASLVVLGLELATFWSIAQGGLTTRHDLALYIYILNACHLTSIARDPHTSSCKCDLELGEKRFPYRLYRVGFTWCDGVKSLTIRESLGVDLMFFWIKKSQSSWLEHLQGSPLTSSW